jgi:hypothetical protein
MIDIPVALFGFRRPDLLQGALEQLVSHKIRKVHVILDAAPLEKPDIVEQASLCRKVVAKSWPGLELVLHLAQSNLGCRGRVLTGLDAVFQAETEAIILEDDIRVGPDFYLLCGMVLNQFSTNPRIGSVTGTAFQGIRRAVPAPVFLSRYTGSWGWATWRDRWQKFRADNLRLAVLDQPKPPDCLKVKKEEWLFWQNRTGRARSGSLDTWDYPWQAFCWQAGWLTVRPSANLTVNLGFGPLATHTRDKPPGVLEECEPWTRPTHEDFKKISQGPGDEIISDWIRPGSHRPARRLRRLLRSWW